MRKASSSYLYFDPSRFSLTPAIPYAWRPWGQTLAIPSAASPRLNILGFMSPAHQSHFQTVTGTVTSATMIAALDAFAAQTARAGKLRFNRGANLDSLESSIIA